MANIRRALQDTLIGARASKVDALARSFTNALSANQLLQPADGSAKFFLLELIRTDSGNPAVTSARQSLGAAYLKQMRSALTMSNVHDADAWLNEAHTIGFAGDDLAAAETELAALRDRPVQQPPVVGAGTLQRTKYVAPKFPVALRNHAESGWVELEFTVTEDGSTADIVVTNSSPRRTFDSSAISAVREWRYQPLVRDGKP